MNNIYIKIIISLLPAVGLYFLGMSILSNDVQIFGFISYYYLMGVLFITPLAYLFTQVRAIKKYSNVIISYRRSIGIMAWVFALIHMLKFDQKIYEMWAKFYAEEQGFISFVFDSVFNKTGSDILGMNMYAFWSGLIGVIIMFLLLVTSNNVSQRILWLWIWKRLQQLVYPLFIVVVIHIYFIGWWKWIYLYPAILLFSLRFYSWFDKNFHYTWRQRVSHSGYRRFLCPPCGFIYDEELWDIDWWLAPGTRYEEIPDDWVCPVCWAAKKDFIPLDGHYSPEQWGDHELQFTVVSKSFLTTDVIELQLHCENELEVLPWQFCNLMFESEGEKQMRSYSVSLYRDKTLTFLIKLKEGWVAWEALRAMWEGSELQWIWPFWNFILQNTSCRKIFIATWTGLSPIYNMIHASWDSEKVLYFWIRRQSDIFYLEELSKIPNLTIHVYLSQEESDPYNFWRIEYSKIESYKDDEIYMCWSPWLIEDLQREFNKQWKYNIFLEKFL